MFGVSWILLYDSVFDFVLWWQLRVTSLDGCSDGDSRRTERNHTKQVKGVKKVPLENTAWQVQYAMQSGASFNVTKML